MVKDLIRNYCDSLDVNGYFNGAILVSHKGEAIFSKGYGFADYSFDIINSIDTKFRIGSLTKAFTAMAILQLEMKGTLRIEDSVDKYISDFPSGNKITIHHLLCHMSGVADFASSPDYWFKNMRLPSSLRATIDNIKNNSLDFEPGSRMEYSNSGYTILAYIIEMASGLSYEEYLRENIFKPLGMKDTGCDDGRAIIKNYAKGYTIDKNIINAEFIDMSIATGAYGIYSTISDLFKWDKALYSDILVNKEQLEKMFTLHNELCGYDWFFRNININNKESAEWYHFGDVNGFTAYYLRYPVEELSVIVLSNFNLTPVDKISRDISEIVFKEKAVNVENNLKILVDDKIAASIAGIYKSDNMRIDIYKEGNKLYAAVPKLYGVVYNYEISPVEIENERVRFKARHIDDTFIIDLAGASMEYFDPYKNCITYKKY